MQTNTRRRGVSVLLILAMLIVSVAALVPVAASASPVGANASDIQDFMFQTLSDANQDDTQTDLRFLFSIGDLDYDAVGFVFSKSNSAPTAGATNTFSTTTVYSSVTADGNDIPAPTGRYWVAVKLSEIPLADFESTIYVRPFIKEGDDYSYVDAKSITVCEALTFDKTVAGESSIYNSKSPAGDYKSGDDFVFFKKADSIRGTNHFYPASLTVGATDGNDLWFEYSFLWNSTLGNTTIDDSKSEIKVISFRNQSSFSKYRDFYYLYTRDNASGSCPYVGHFDYSTYKTGCNPGWSCAVDPESGHPIYTGDWISVAEDHSPYIGEYGWHRLSVRFHQEVESVSGSTVTYSGYSELYIDGVKVWKVFSDMQGSNSTSLKEKGLLLWTATASNGAITGYADNDNLRAEMRIMDVANSTNAVYVAVSDIHWTCGDGFVRQVSPVANPAARTITLDDKGTPDTADDVTCTGKIWYVFDN